MEWLPAVISVIGAVVVAWLSKRSSAAAAKTAATAAPYDALASRVATLEAQVDEARRTIHHLASKLDAERDARREAEARMADLERLLAVEQERAQAMAGRIEVLEGELDAAGLPVPPHVLPPGAS